MNLAEYTEPVIRLILAAALGAIIGFERESLHKPAGLRTHVLVSVASCLVTLVSIMAFPEDPARLLAQIIPGIGFIGAGSIIASGEKVIGITTATGIFVTSSIGIAVGTGNYVLAIAAVFIVGFVMYSGFLTYKEDKPDLAR
ncbi:MgtC/SapB family protein [Candidatus Bathyarchaeota archaeon]|jgi:putative Mg2+ transporter-C (MgtC) family protein|nr:MgtC/SapB family protein [Candidatus Bathyarchaeota archaeon]MBT4320478.1 MgtC/SapB family protein [Candidatus Bathyarchaeota archaeon]MBT4424934.1 MgtC/SapB family protein [Candidatus Bathyarchaeota archaeon]MBT5642649.1 MgtC/SapB family protein [Candidatus Bathyarchaeota archaeon]MBT6604517.1 MgtC/SapB family protein [Candidatus Bathyarchaeota archaeon]